MTMNFFTINKHIIAIFLICISLAGRDAFAGPWILLDADSGKLIAQNRATRPWHPASVIKLMTAYTVFREVERGHISLSSPVRVSALALSMPPSKMGFPVGTIMTFDNAIKIIMVKSANDIALAIAQSAKGSVAAFAEAMNENARRLGMENSHFVNPHGLHHPAQVTSAQDMAILALALQNEFPQYAHYFDISSIRFGKVRMRNHNGLIFKFSGTNGFKTGYTCASGLNIVARVKRGGRQLIAVVLGEYSSAERNVLTARLLSLGFGDQFNMHERPHISELTAITRQYAVPANMLPMICKPSRKERQLTKKQRRAKRKLHLANLKLAKDTHLNDTVKVNPAIKVTLGGAYGPNPYNLKLVKGGTPPSVIGTPIWRPDQALPPVEG